MSSRSSNRSNIKSKIGSQINTFITGTKNFAFNSDTENVIAKTELFDERIKYQKEIRNLMNTLKGIY